MQSQREGEGDEVGALGEPTESKYEEAEKEGTENARDETTREDLPNALSAVNGVHVADDLLSQALRLFTLRRDRSTARHPRGSLLVSSKDHVGPSKMDAVWLSRPISS